MNEIAEIIKEFLIECHENLDILDQDLVQLESTPDDRERLSGVFRTIHTIKGTSGFLALPILERITHLGESLLVDLRDGKLRLNSEIADGLLKMVDAVRAILHEIEETQEEGGEDHADVCELLLALRTSESQNIEKCQTVETEKSVSENSIGPATGFSESSVDATGLGGDAEQEQAEEIHIPDDHIQELLSVKIVKGESEAANEKSETRPIPQPNHRTSAILCDDHRALEKVEELQGDDSDDLQDEEQCSLIADQTIRIEVSLLDRLMSLIGELVLARNQMLQFNKSGNVSSLQTTTQRINHITTELQSEVMKTRMQPINKAWSKLPRLVRDIASGIGKRVRIIMEGGETELDKTVIEAIRDPLTHLVRNAIDHGIETPCVRVEKNKNPEGQIKLKSYHECGKVIVEISDNGAGISREKVIAKAINLGMISPVRSEMMTDQEVYQMILAPGFSTAAQVTNVSGRGVGMDVVKTNVEKIGGTLEISSVKNSGTTFKVKIPLTLAIVPAITVLAASHRFAIPQINLVELVRVDLDKAIHRIEFIYSSPVIFLRDEILPIIYLDETLKLRKKRTQDEHLKSGIIIVVIVQCERHKYGLIVDKINDTEEIVVKPVSSMIKSINMYSGATIMGDGNVALILDVNGISDRELSEIHARGQLANSTTVDEKIRKIVKWLLVETERFGIACVPIDQISRLEEVDPADIESDRCQYFIQFNGQVIVLSPEMNSLETLVKGQATPMIVFGEGVDLRGVVVKRVVDIVETTEVEGSFNTNRFVETEIRIINNKVTRCLSIESLYAKP